MIVDRSTKQKKTASNCKKSLTLSIFLKEIMQQSDPACLSDSPGKEQLHYQSFFFFLLFFKH